MKPIFNALSGKFDYVSTASDFENDFLKLDQTTPQTISNDSPVFNTLTASKVVFTDGTKKLTSTGSGTSSQFVKGDGSLDSSTYLTAESDTLNTVCGRGASYTAGNVTLLGVTIGANTLNTSEWANLDGTDQTVATTSNIKSYGRDMIRYAYLMG